MSGESDSALPARRHCLNLSNADRALPSDPGPVLHTERLILRPPCWEDFEPWAAFMADPEAARFLGGAQERAAVWRGLMCMAGAWQLRGFAMFSVIERSTGRWIGRLGPWQPEGWPGTEVGWGLAREAWGKGYAFEGACASIDWAFQNLGWSEVIHTIDPANHNSIRLAERLGSTDRGPGQLPAPFAHIAVRIWAQSKAQWFARRGRGDAQESA